MSLVEHAKRELELLGETDQEYIDGIVKVIQAFADCGHSGGSASVAIPTIHDLLQFKPLSPLTNDPSEWNEVGSEVWQSSRNPEAFSSDGGKTYYLLSEMTPYYESAEHGETSGTSDEAAAEPSIVPPTTKGDTVVPVEVVTDQ